ncbi:MULTISPECIES: DNA repair ATPase [Hymenobacter]|uniref:DNA repair ATPase n=1 Tax=Hymenobacter jejuensis TaxID=2502781 RepID=A0A5B8A0K7_9BACT|nr:MULTISPECIES: DNA repair ATPase [Hymenobacter]MBC6990623.1 DNA repair ATPase [Hymenobacter sp. BT491]QDA60964.1 DNA repair ATPase [Hymenobacter jejuensis]
MKRSILLSLLLMFVLTVTGYAQKSPVDETDMAVKGIPRKGQRVTIQLDSKRVDDSWLKHLNEKFGNKVKADKGVYSMDGVIIEEISKTPVRVISKVDATPTGTTVWWSLDLGNAYLSKDATPVQWKSAEGFLKDFARKLYREDLAIQVAEAEKALVSSQNNHMAVIAKSDAIKKDIEKNKAKKQEIQQQLAQNAAELLQYNNQIDMNLKEQEAARADIVNMRVALEAVKDRMNKIE